MCSSERSLLPAACARGTTEEGRKVTMAAGHASACATHALHAHKHAHQFIWVNVTHTTGHTTRHAAAHASAHSSTREPHSAAHTAHSLVNVFTTSSHVMLASLFRVTQNGICFIHLLEHLLRLSYLLFSLRILVRMPFKGQLPESILDFFFTGGLLYAKNLVIILLRRFFLSSLGCFHFSLNSKIIRGDGFSRREVLDSFVILFEKHTHFPTLDKCLGVFRVHFDTLVQRDDCSFMLLQFRLRNGFVQQKRGIVVQVKRIQSHTFRKQPNCLFEFVRPECLRSLIFLLSRHFEVLNCSTSFCLVGIEL